MGDVPPDPAAADYFLAYRILGYVAGFALAAVFLNLRKDKPGKWLVDVFVIFGTAVVGYLSFRYYLEYRRNIENFYGSTTALFVITNACIAILLAYAIPVLAALFKLVQGKNGKPTSGDKAQSGG